MNFDEPLAFTDNFNVRAFISGCYYFSESRGMWSDDGLTLLGDTNLERTHCLTTHLTLFAGGLVFTPSTINFALVHTEPPFQRNPIIWSTAIVVTCLYVICALIARYWDRRDATKVGVCPLQDNREQDKYYYEIIVFTGSRPQAATDSKVKIIITGDGGETNVRLLDDPERAVFRRGGMDSFVMSVER